MPSDRRLFPPRRLPPSSHTPCTISACQAACACPLLSTASLTSFLRLSLKLQPALVTALFARSLQASRVAVFQRSLPAVGIRLVSLASRVTADLAARAVAAWRVIHGFLVSFSHTSIKSFAHLSVKLTPRNFAPQYTHVPYINHFPSSWSHASNSSLVCRHSFCRSLVISFPTVFPAFPLPSACAASSARNRYKTHSSDKIHLRNDLLAL